MCFRFPLSLLTTAVVLAAPLAAHGQPQTVRPGVNEEFQNPDAAHWVERFEREGRDVYAKRHTVVAACELKKGMTVADIGAGSGLFTLLMARQVGPSGRVYAVDIAKSFVQAIEKRAADEGLANVTGIVCTADDAKLPRGRVDLAFICDTYHHFEFPQRTLASIHRAMKPGGQLVLIEFKRIEGVSSEWAMHHIRAGKEVFTEEIEQAGFRFLDEKPMFWDKYMLRFERVEPVE